MEDQQTIPGMVEMIVYPDKERGKVVQRFKQPMAQVEYDPDNMCDIACAMTDAAFELREGHKPASETLKAELIERHRRTLTNRLAIMIGSMRENKKLNHRVLAQRLVEACLKEIF